MIRILKLPDFMYTPNCNAPNFGGNSTALLLRNHNIKKAITYLKHRLDKFGGYDKNRRRKSIRSEHTETQQ